MSRTLLAGFALCTVVAAQAGDGFEAPLLGLIEAERRVDSYDEAVRVAKRFERIADAHPQAWIPRYWAAYACSQTAALSTQGPEPWTSERWLDRAQQQLDRAHSVLATPSARDRADFNVLQAAIHYIRAATGGGRDDPAAVEPPKQLMQEQLARAFEADPDNPMAWMLRGIAQVEDDATRDAGRETLAIAREKYAARRPETPIHPDWGRGWIDLWLAQFEPSAAKETDP